MNNFVKCENCRFSIMINHDKVIMECRKGLPTLDPYGRSAWPRVAKTDGCFEGKNKDMELLNE